MSSNAVSELDISMHTTSSTSSSLPEQPTDDNHHSEVFSGMTIPRTTPADTTDTTQSTGGMTVGIVAGAVVLVVVIVAVLVALMMGVFIWKRSSLRRGKSQASGNKNLELSNPNYIYEGK